MRADPVLLVILSIFWVMGCSEAQAPVSQLGNYTRARHTLDAYAELYGYPAKDLWGNKYPDACRQDLAHLDIAVKRMDLSGLIPTSGGRVLGYWVPHGPKYGTVVISSDIDETTSSHVFHHEACHGYMHVHFGDSGWHR